MVPKMSKIDIAVPNYQYGKYLQACVESILDQGIDDIRILIIDNASTDDSVTVAERLCERDNRISLTVHSTNIGMHGSMNEALDWAEGEYFVLLCADDILAPGFLQRAVALMDSAVSASFCYGIEQPFVGDDPPVAAALPPSVPSLITGRAYINARFAEAERIVSCGTIFARTASQKAVGHYRREVGPTSDLEFLLRMAMRGDVMFSGAVHAWRRLHGGNLSETSGGGRVTAELSARAGALRSFLAVEGKSLEDADGLRCRMQRRLAARAYWWGLRHASSGRPAAALECFRFACSLAPSMALIPPVDFLFREDGPVLRRRLGMPGHLTLPWSPR